MPFLHKYVDRDGCYVNITYGEVGVKTWQISSAGIEWLRNRGCHAGQEFGRPEFHCLKKLKFVTKGSGSIRKPARKRAKRIHYVDSTRTSRNRPGGVVPSAQKRFEAASRHSTLQRNVTDPPRSLKKDNTPQNTSRSPGTHSRAQGYTAPIALQPATSIRRPTLIAVSEGTHWHLEILLPGFAASLSPSMKKRIRQRQLAVETAPSPIPLEKFAECTVRTKVLPKTSPYAIDVLPTNSGAFSCEIWTAGCRGLNPQGTLFRFGHASPRIGPGSGVYGGDVFLVAWRNDHPYPPFADEDFPRFTPIEDWLCRMIRFADVVNMEQRWWLGDIDLIFGTHRDAYVTG